MGIKICITVDWEGEDLSCVPDLKRVRDKVGHEVPFTHFICPNYFSFAEQPQKSVAKIREAVFDSDEIGLHIHCYRELIENIVGIPFRTEQNYHNLPSWIQAKIIKRINPNYQHPVSGRGVPLSVYDADEIEQIVRKSKKLLSENLEIENIKGFRAGGWIANDTVLQAVEKAGFLYDSSAVPPAILSQGFSEISAGNGKDDYGDRNGIFTEHILKLWGYETQNGFLKNSKTLQANGAISIGNQPYKMGNLTEIPNNVGLTDFCLGEKTVLPLIKNYLHKLEENPDQDFVVVYGCHQEGDAFFKAQLVDFVYEVQELASAEISFVRMEDVLV